MALRRWALGCLGVTLAIPPVHFTVGAVRTSAPAVSVAARAERARLLPHALVLTDDIVIPDLGDGWNDSVPEARVSCIHVPKPAHGTTLKFTCRLPTGDLVKVKYGRTRERQAEVAATTLLASLGFGADHVRFVRRLDCYGCPPSPFRTRLLAEQFLVTGLIERLQDNTRARRYEWVTVERELPGREIGDGDLEGWSWAELDQVQARAGGATRAQLDALRLMAIFLAHWDAKPANQRLLCIGDRVAQAACTTPLLMLQDVGSTFGPGKATLGAWRDLPIWDDRATCTVSMADLPYRGAGFPRLAISEDGRRLLAGRLGAWTPARVRALFTRARFADAADPLVAARDLDEWTAAFLDKVAAIADGPACPPILPLSRP